MKNSVTPVCFAVLNSTEDRLDQLYFCMLR